MAESLKWDVDSVNFYTSDWKESIPLSNLVDIWLRPELLCRMEIEKGVPTEKVIDCILGFTDIRDLWLSKHCEWVLQQARSEYTSTLDISQIAAE